MERLSLSDFLNQRRLDRNIGRVAAGDERAPMAAEDLFEVLSAPRDWSQSTDDALLSAGINPDDLLGVSGSWDPTVGAEDWFGQFGGLEGTQRDVSAFLGDAATDQFAPRVDAPAIAERAQQAQDSLAEGAVADDQGTVYDRIMDQYESGNLTDPSGETPDIDVMRSGIVGGESERTADARSGFWGDALDRQQTFLGGVAERALGGWVDHLDRGPVTNPIRFWLGDDAGDAYRGAQLSVSDRLENLREGEGFVPTQLPQIEQVLFDLEQGTATVDTFEELNEIIERGQASERELQALNRALQRAEIRGFDTERGDGALVGSMQLLQRPQSALVGLISGLGGEEALDERDEEVEAVLEPGWQTGLSRFLRGFTGDRVDTPSNYTPWDQEEWDWDGTRTVGNVPVNARMARGTAHTADFIADVIGDPITYLTFGAGGLTRKATSELASRAVVSTARKAGKGELTRLSPAARQALVEHAGPDASFVNATTDFANRANVLIRREGDRVVAVPPAEGQVARNTNDTVAEALWRQVDGVADVDRAGAWRVLEPLLEPRAVQEFLEGGLAQMAGGVRHGFGSTGLRRQLREVFGDDSVFDLLPKSVRGGAQLTVPFVTKRTDFGTDMRWSLELTKGGGRNPLARASADWYNHARRQVAGSAMGQRWQGLFGGRAAAGLQQTTQELMRTSEDVAGRAWSHYQAVQSNFIESGARRRALADQAKNTAQAADVHLRQAADYDVARDALRTVFAARGSKTLDPRTGRMIDADGNLTDTVIEGVTPLSQLPQDAVEAAEGAMQTFALHMDDLIGQLRQLGDIGYLGPDYTPRVFAQQLDEVLEAGGSRFTISRSGNYATHRISGDFNVETQSWLSAIEVRQEAARRGDTGIAFVDNPLEAMTDYIDAASSLLDRMHTLEGFRRAGLIIDVTPTDARVYTDAGARDLLAEAASNLGGANRQVQALKEAIGKGDEEAMRRAFGPLADRIGADRAQEILEAASRVTVRRASPPAPPAAATPEPRQADVDLAREVAADMAADGGQAARRFTDPAPEGGWQALDANGRVIETFETEQAAQLYANRQNHISGNAKLVSTIEDELLSDTETLNQLLHYSNIPTDNPQQFRQHIEAISNRVGQWLNEADPDRVQRVLQRSSSTPGRYRELLAQQQGWNELPEQAKDVASARMLAESGAFSTDSVIRTLWRQSKPWDDFAEVYSETVQPAYTFFKTYATFGSGPRFAIRNAIGGHSINWTQGVTGTHIKNSLAIMEIEEKAKRAVRREAQKAGQSLTRAQMVERVKDDVRRRMVTRWGDDKGNRFADALELFYERNLMTGSRTDDLLAPTALGNRGTQQNAADVLGGEFTSRMRGGPQTGGLGDTAVTPATGWRRALLSEGRYADQMDPALRRLAGMESTVFAGRGRQELLEGAGEGASLRARAAAGARRAVQESLDNPYTRFGASMAEMSEKWTRLAPFLRGLDDYGIEDGGRAAGLLVKAGQFDYSDLTDFERRFMRQVLPFYTFSRNNVPFQVRALANSPDKIAKLGHAHHHFEDTFGDDRWEERFLPRWVRDNMGVPVDWAPADAPDWTRNIPIAGVLFQSQDPIAWNLSSMPAMDLNKVLGPSARDELVGMLNPLFKTVAELGTGIDSFTRGDLPDNERVEWAPEWMRFLPGFSRDDSGDINVSTYLSRPVRNALPPVGQAERLLGSTERYEDRMFSSWASTLLGLPVSTLDQFQIRGEVRRETERISRGLSRQLGRDISPSDLDVLLKQGFPIDVIRDAAEDGQLDQLFEMLDIYEAGREDG